MCDDWYINENGEKLVYSMVFSDNYKLKGKPKGIKQVLTDSVSNESSRVEFESILKYYLYNGVYPINCLKYIIYIMQVYASLMRVKIWNTKNTELSDESIPLLTPLLKYML